MVTARLSSELISALRHAIADKGLYRKLASEIRRNSHASLSQLMLDLRFQIAAHKHMRRRYSGASSVPSIEATREGWDALNSLHARATNVLKGIPGMLKQAKLEARNRGTKRALRRLGALQLLERQRRYYERRLPDLLKDIKQLNIRGKARPRS